MAKTKKTNKIKGVKGFAILNAYGEFWTINTFQSEIDAKNYMDRFWAGIKQKPDMSKHKIISVLITPIKVGGKKKSDKKSK